MIKLPDAKVIHDGKSEKARQRCEGWNACLAEVQRLNATAQPDDGNDGYVKAFYEIASILGISAQPNSPKHVFETVMKPMLQGLLDTAQPVSNAASDVLAERLRQVSQEGWTPEHDDTHSSGEMAGAAACYARHVNGRQWIYPSRPEDYLCEEAPESWPWDEAWWKPKSPRKDLVHAAALLIAEIERLDRLAAAPGGQDD